MSSWFSASDGMDSSAGHPGEASCSGRGCIEALEDRRLLAADLLGTRFFLDGNHPLVADEVFLGNLVITAASDSSELRNRTRAVELDLSETGHNGRVDGILLVEDLGAFDVTGIVRPNGGVNLVFSDGAAGTIRGRLSRDDEVLAARFASNDDDETIRGRLRLFAEDTDEFDDLADEFGFFDDGFIFDSDFVDDDFFFSDGFGFFNDGFFFGSGFANDGFFFGTDFVDDPFFVSGDLGGGFAPVSNPFFGTQSLNPRFGGNTLTGSFLNPAGFRQFQTGAFGQVF